MTEQGRTSAARTAPRVTGDELFVPASHMLIADRTVSHPAFRLWCVLHRLWFLREPPTMDVLQTLMGSAPTTRAETAISWQPATRRSIERWLNELEAAGWLVWHRREDASRRYHLRTSARSADDSAALSALRSLLNTGKTTLADVQALLSTVTNDASLVSPGSIPGSHGAAAEPLSPPTSAISPSHHAPAPPEDATSGSQQAIDVTAAPIAGSQLPIPVSQGTTAMSNDATQGSLENVAEQEQMHQDGGSYKETHAIQRSEETPPSSSPTREAGEGLSATAQYLLANGCSARVAREFAELALALVTADFTRRRESGQGIGAIVTAWRVQAPQASPPDVRVSELQTQAAAVKAQAIALAPDDASALDVQYLTLDLEDGYEPAVALQRLVDRRAGR